MVVRTMRWIVLALGTAAVVCSVLPFLESNEWWIRVWDFPRVQLAVVLAAVLLAVPLLFSLRSRQALAFTTAVACAFVWQLYRVHPYTPLQATEAKAASDCRDGMRISLLVANVLVSHDDEQPLLDLVRQLEPDVVLLVETDWQWHRRLAPLRTAYPHAIAQPQDNGYGMHLFSRFELLEPKIRYLIDDYVPSIKTGLHLPSGDRIDLHGLHPKPPPIQDTARRDAELLIVGREVSEEPTAAIVAGDLNDVAWSRTTQLFQEVSGLLDPRVGRGPYPTFNADWPLLRWPLDHVFFEESFWLMELAVMGDIGSDHFPFFTVLCHDPSAARAQEEPEAEADDSREAGATIREGRQEAQDEAED